MIVLTKEQIIFLHTQLIASTGGSDGIRDNGLLESAICQYFAAKYAARYQSFAAKYAARYQNDPAKYQSFAGSL